MKVRTAFVFVCAWGGTVPHCCRGHSGLIPPTTLMSLAPRTCPREGASHPRTRGKPLHGQNHGCCFRLRSSGGTPNDWATAEAACEEAAPSTRQYGRGYAAAIILVGPIRLQQQPPARRPNTHRTSHAHADRCSPTARPLASHAPTTHHRTIYACAPPQRPDADDPHLRRCQFDTRPTQKPQPRDQVRDPDRAVQQQGQHAPPLHVHVWGATPGLGAVANWAAPHGWC